MSLPTNVHTCTCNMQHVGTESSWHPALGSTWRDVQGWQWLWKWGWVEGADGGAAPQSASWPPIQVQSVLSWSLPARGSNRQPPSHKSYSSKQTNIVSNRKTGSSFWKQDEKQLLSPFRTLADVLCVRSWKCYVRSKLIHMCVFETHTLRKDDVPGIGQMFNIPKPDHTKSTQDTCKAWTEKKWKTYIL